MSRNRLHVLFAAALALGVAACGGADQEAAPGGGDSAAATEAGAAEGSAEVGAQEGPAELIALGEPAPDFALRGATRYGVLAEPVRLSDYRGKTVVLAFFFRARGRG